MIDISYEALDALARRAAPVPARPAGEGVEAPALLSAPPVVAPHQAQSAAGVASGPADIRGRDVWLVHPWALGEPPRDLPPDTVRLGFQPAEFHRRWGWSERRWAFVGQRMRELTGSEPHADTATLAQRLAVARAVHTVAEPHAEAALRPLAGVRPAGHLFADVARPCGSFSRWWKEATRGVRSLHDLPGLAAIAAARPDGSHAPWTPPAKPFQIEEIHR